MAQSTLTYEAPASIQMLTSRMVKLPLVHLTVLSEVYVAAAVVTMRCQFRNIFSQGEMLVIVPLSEDSIVFRASAEFNGRDFTSTLSDPVSTAENEPTPRNSTNKKKKRGDSTAVATLKPLAYCPRVFRMAIPDVPKHAVITVNVAYFEPLQYKAGAYRLFVPLRLSKDMIGGAKPQEHLHLKLLVHASAPPSKWDCPSHPLSSSLVDLSTTLLQGDLRNMWENTDLVFTYSMLNQKISALAFHQPPAKAFPGSGSELNNSASTPTKQSKDNKGPLCVLPETENGRSTFTVVITPPTPSAVNDFNTPGSGPETPPGAVPPSGTSGASDNPRAFSVSHTGNLPNSGFPLHVVWVVDVTRSMQGSPLEFCKSAMLQSLPLLTPKDRLNIIGFSGDQSVFAKTLLRATPQNVHAAQRFIEGLDANGESTDLTTALTAAVDMVAQTTEGSDEPVVPVVCLMTDGSAGSDHERQLLRHLVAKLGHDSRRESKQSSDSGDSSDDEEAGNANTKRRNSNDKPRKRKKKFNPSTRINTFGIGSFCNQFFLQSLAQQCRGRYLNTLTLSDSHTTTSASLQARLQHLLVPRIIVLGLSLSIPPQNAHLEDGTEEQQDDNHQHTFEITTNPNPLPDVLVDEPVVILAKHKSKNAGRALPQKVTVHGLQPGGQQYAQTISIDSNHQIPVHVAFGSIRHKYQCADLWFKQDERLREELVQDCTQSSTPCSLVPLRYGERMTLPAEPDKQTPGAANESSASIKRQTDAEALHPEEMGQHWRAQAARRASLFSGTPSTGLPGGGPTTVVGAGPSIGTVVPWGVGAGDTTATNENQRTSQAMRELGNGWSGFGQAGENAPNQKKGGCCVVM